MNMKAKIISSRIGIFRDRNCLKKHAAMNLIYLLSYMPVSVKPLEVVST